MANSSAFDKLRSSALCSGLNDLEVQQVLEAVRPLTVASGQIICQYGEESDTMFIVAAGRVKVCGQRTDGTELLLNYHGPGEHFGELAMLTGAQRTATVAAVMDTELFTLDRDGFQCLSTVVPFFAVNLSRSLSRWLRGMLTGKKTRHVPAAVALAGYTPLARSLVRLLANQLVAHHVPLQVLTDRRSQWPADNDYPVYSLPDQDRETAIRAHLAQALVQRQRVLLDIGQDDRSDALPRLLKQCDEVWWLLELAELRPARQRLERLLEAEPGLAARMHLVWACRPGEPFPPVIHPQLGLADPDFRVELGEDRQPAPLQQRGLSRLVHHLQRLRLGLALGGGGARGISHIGIFRAFEEAGLFFDLIAGTSAGALIGVPYAQGFLPPAIAEFVRTVFVPSKLLRWIPWGDRWNILALYRFNGLARALRHSLGDGTLEQSPTPVCTVTVDLITGKAIVRDRGDAVTAMLESANIPGISRSILRDGAALVDGGVLNNVPSDVLRDRGMDLVVAVDVGARMAHKFGANLPTTPTHEMRNPGLLETMLRTLEVQQHGLMSTRATGVDLVIAPDASMFGFAEFSKYAEIIEVGRAAAEQAIPKLKLLLADLAGRNAPGAE